MGCTASKLDNEETVRRCKDHRRLIKKSVYARHHLAAAHSDYCRSLRITGSALVAFASGEPLSVSHHTPAVLLRNPSSSTVKPPAFVPPPNDHILSPSHSLSSRPPPSPPLSTTSSHQSQPPPPRRKKPIKLPHILSDSSFSSSPPHLNKFTYNAAVNSTYSTTPSQASSAWNWDNLYPPPPLQTPNTSTNSTTAREPQAGSKRTILMMIIIIPMIKIQALLSVSEIF